MIKIEIPAHEKALVAAIGRALFLFGAGADINGVIPPTAETAPQDDRVDGSAPVEYTAGDVIVDSEGQQRVAVEGYIDLSIEANREQFVGTGADLAVTATVEVVEEDADELGVAFNAAFCGKATIPFYGSGKKKGQWKKLKGVDEAAYDTWYATQLEPGAAQTAHNADMPDPGDGTVDTGAAFGGVGDTEQPATAIPTNAGDFMLWVSELQAAGRLTQEHIGNAYQATGLQALDLFAADVDQATVAANVASLYAILNAAAAAQ